jgi:hypothetical protein
MREYKESLRKKTAMINEPSGRAPFFEILRAFLAAESSGTRACACTSGQ